MPDEDSLRHKYKPLPEEPRYRKKKKKRHVRSDHKHEYETVCVDSHTTVHTREGEYPSYHMAVRCRLCGRLQEVKLWRYDKTLPEGMPMYEVEDFLTFVKMKKLPESMKVRG